MQVNSAREFQGINFQAFWRVFLLIVGLAAVVRFYSLNGQSMMVDEVTYAWGISRLPVDHMLQALREVGTNPPVYFFFLKGFMQLLGESETALRLFSVIIDLVAIITVMALGYEFGGTWGAGAAGWFWAFHPFTTWYSRVARPYAMAACLSAVLLFLFWRVRRRPSPAYWLAAWLVITTGLLTQYFFFLMVSALLLIALTEMPRSQRFFRYWTLVSLLGMLPLSIWLAWYFQLSNPVIGTGWIPQPALADLLLSLANFLSGWGGEVSLSALLFGLISTTFISLALFASFHRPIQRLAAQMAALGIAAPLLALWIISQRRPLYVDRYLFALLPCVALLVAAGAGELRHRLQAYVERGWVKLLRIGIVVGMLVIGINSAWQVQGANRFLLEDWRGLVAYINQARNGNSPLTLWLSEPEAVIPLYYYQIREYEKIGSVEPPACQEACWWVLRQPYTLTHALAQGVTQVDRPWHPDIPSGCSLLDRWDSPSGIAAWQVLCQ